MELVVAVDQNWAIGNQGDQLVYIPEDLKHFKELTLGKTVIAGLRTLATFPGGRPLKNRENWILCHDPKLAPEGARVFYDLESLLEADPKDAVVIGGASVYKALLPYCDTAHITKLEAAYPADTWFPNLDEDEAWEVAEVSEPYMHEDLTFRYVTYKRK